MRSRHGMPQCTRTHQADVPFGGHEYDFRDLTEADSPHDGVGEPSSAAVSGERLVWWQDIRPEIPQIPEGDHAAHLKRELAEAAIEMNWSIADVDRVVQLLKSEHAATGAASLPSGATFMRNLDEHVPGWTEQLQHVTEKFDVDGRQYEVHRWDIIVQLGLILQRKRVADEIVLGFRPRFDDTGARVYHEAYECDHFAGACARGYRCVVRTK